MKKSDFIALITAKLSDLSDDDEVLMEIDGGEYWGNYYGEIDIEVKSATQQPEVFVGHPGKPQDTSYVAIKKLAIFKEA